MQTREQIESRIEFLKMVEREFPYNDDLNKDVQGQLTALYIVLKGE